MYYCIDGLVNVFVVVFVNLLGIDLCLWDVVLVQMLQICVICFDKCGYGFSDDSEVFSIDDLVDDVVVLIEYLGFGFVVFVGLFIGGMIVQVFVVCCFDLVCVVVLLNIVVCMGNVEGWVQCIVVVENQGIVFIVDIIMEWWFVLFFCVMFELVVWCNMVMCILVVGYVVVCCMLVVIDLMLMICLLDLLVLVIVGDQDGLFFVDLVCGMVDLIFGVDFYIIFDVGYLFCVEQFVVFVVILKFFVQEYC